MNIRQMDVKRIVAASKRLKDALDQAEVCMETINDIVKANVEKDGKLNYLFEEK